MRPRSPTGLKRRRILELLGAFKEAGRELDDALRAIGEMGRVLGSLLQQLHGAGVRFPSYEQLDVFGDQALRTAIAGSPWGKRHPHLAPNERRSFRTLVDGWSDMIEQRIKSQLG